MEYKSSETPLLNMQGIIGLKYDVIKLIGSGSFGLVYMGRNKKSGEYVAIKCEEKASGSKLLKNETRIYRELVGGIGIANLRWYGVDDTKIYTVLDLLGKSLDDYKEKYKKLSLKTITQIGIQLLYRMEYIHSKGYIHRDIKPENFMFGNTKLTKNILYVIDFGLSKMYKYNNKHIDFREERKMVGTPRYASLNIHDGIEPSRRDDLISIGYMLIYLYKGCLPWQGLKGKTKQEKYQKISNIKRMIGVKGITANMPSEFTSYMEYCYELDFDESPNYDLLNRLFISVLEKNNYINDNIYEWTKK